MRILNDLLQPMQHCELAASKLCEKLNIKVARTSLQKDLLEHPEYPSLLSIKDVIRRYGVESMAVVMNTESIDDVPPPLLAHISGKRTRHPLFAIVSKVGGGNIEMYNPETRREETVSIQDFEQVYLGTLLAVEAGEHAGEKGYGEAVRKERQSLRYNVIAAFSFLFLMVAACIMLLVRAGSGRALAPVLFSMTALAGCIVGVLLLWHEVDRYNPALKQICRQGAKVNCAAVLASGASKIFGLSWSAIGFVYFSGMSLFLLATGIDNPQALFLLSWICALALPYILFSVYYQWLVARQWCILCLAVQGVLLFQFMIAWSGGFYVNAIVSNISYKVYLALAGAYIMPFTAVLLLLPAYEKGKAAREKMLPLLRLKYNSEIFETLLSRQKVVANDPGNLGILLGSPNARNRIIKVCNPYCGPCAVAHRDMDALMDNNPDLQMRIIFTATSEAGDMKAPPVRHLMGISEKGDEQLVRRALDDWYLSASKGYEQFAARYPMSGELKRQDKELDAMSKWCRDTGINFTPTFFLNGHQLPEIYTVEDLNYFLTANS